MSNLLFSVGFIALLAMSLVLCRSLARFAILTLVSITVSGAILQFMAAHSLAVTLPLSQSWLLATGLVLVALALTFRVRNKQHALWESSSSWILLISSGALTLAFLVSRILAPGELAPLSSVGFFVEKVAAEDNAKWLNATSQLADASVIDTWANVGGPLILVLTFAATLIGSVSFLIYGAVNEVAVSAGSVIFTQLFMVIISPFALAPIIERRYRAITGGKQIPTVYRAMSIAILSASTAVLITYGHITLQFTLLVLTLWIASFIAPTKGVPARLLSTSAVVATAMVWFPLAGLALIILIASTIYFLIRAIRSSGDRRIGSILNFGFIVMLWVIMFEFLNSSLRYSLGVDAVAAPEPGTGSAFGGGLAAAVRGLGAPTLPLFDDPGGTETVTNSLLILTILSALGLVWVRLGNSSLTRNQLVAFSPIILSGGYALLIAFADIWAVGSGPNYGSLKIGFAIFIPILVTALPFALMTFHKGSSQVNALGFTAVALIVVLLTLDTLFPRAIQQLRPTNWPSVSSSPYWYPAEVRDTGSQSLADNPIGCTFLPRGAEQPTAIPQGQLIYSCTRLLSGVAGVEALAAPIVKWQLDEWLQNREMWSEMHPYFSGMSPEILGRTLILLDEDRAVVGLETLSGLLRRYQPLDTP